MIAHVTGKIRFELTMFSANSATFLEMIIDTNETIEETGTVVSEEKLVAQDPDPEIVIEVSLMQLQLLYQLIIAFHFRTQSFLSSFLLSIITSEFQVNAIEVPQKISKTILKLLKSLKINYLQKLILKNL